MRIGLHDAEREYLRHKIALPYFRQRKRLIYLTLY